MQVASACSCPWVETEKGRNASPRSWPGAQRMGALVQNHVLRGAVVLAPGRGPQVSCRYEEVALPGSSGSPEAHSPADSPQRHCSPRIRTSSFLQTLQAACAFHKWFSLFCADFTCPIARSRVSGCGDPGRDTQPQHSDTQQDCWSPCPHSSTSPGRRAVQECPHPAAAFCKMCFHAEQLASGRGWWVSKGS